MGLFRRRGGGGGGDGNGETEALTTITEEVPPIPDIDDAITEKAQEIMKSNLEIMKEIVMKIRNEPGYAKSMYINCPRLQHLLEQNPDLRPVFEDPRLVRINFETVYKEAGGILPEDEGGTTEDDDTKNKKSWILWIANSPFFKILKALLLIKKLVGCIAGGGIAAIGGIIAFMTDCCTDCCCEDALEEIELEEDLDDLEDIAGGGSLDPNAQALNQAADYMEDPNVQEQMQRLLEDPDNLADAIENDSELRTLRDSNPLCAELMQDPETMRILVDPDNLRALGEAPQMIELDFADPNGFIPEDDFIDIEMGDDATDGGATAAADAADYAALDVDYDNDGSGDFDADAEDNDMDGDDAEGDDAEGDEEEEEDEGWEEDIEMEETELDADNKNAEAAKGKGKGGNNKKSAAQEAAAKKGGMAGVIASIGVAATDVIASQIVGQVFGDIPLGDLMSSGGGGDDIDLGGLDSAGDMVNDDIADIAEDGVDEVKDGKDGMKGGPLLSHAELASGDDSMYDADGRKRFSGAGVAAGAGAAGAMMIGGAGAGAMLHGRRKVSEDNLAIPEGHEEKDESDSDGFDSVNSNEDYDEFDDEENTKNKYDEDDDDDDDDDDKKKKKKRFGLGALKDIAAATATAAKETLASTFLGDDVAEMLVERMEESDSDEDDDDDGKKKKSKGRKNNDDDIESGDEFEDEVEKPKSKKRGVFRGGKR